MIGNDACGSRALGYGRTADNVLGLDLVTGTGDALSVSRGDRGTEARGFDGGVAALKGLVAQHLAVLRTEFGRFERQISGYALEHLLPEKKFDLTRALVGSEGTLGVLTEATLRLVTEPGDRVLVALGFADITEAGHAAVEVLPYDPTACEGIDSRIVDVVRRRQRARTIPSLPRGGAWLLVELSGVDRPETLSRARRLVAEVVARTHASSRSRGRQPHSGESGRMGPAWPDGRPPALRLGRAGKTPRFRPPYSGPTSESSRSWSAAMG